MPSTVDVAVDFLDIAFNQRDPRRAFRTHVGNSYKQHNPHAPDGVGPSAEFLEGFVQSVPEMQLTIHRTIAQDDLVAVHAHLGTGADDPGSAIVDILRIVDGKIVEHWDVAQSIPLSPANANTMF